MLGIEVIVNVCGLRRGQLLYGVRELDDWPNGKSMSLNADRGLV